MGNINIAKNLRILASSAESSVSYGNIKNNEEVKRAIEAFKHLNIDVLFK